MGSSSPDWSPRMLAASVLSGFHQCGPPVQVAPPPQSIVPPSFRRRKDATWHAAPDHLAVMPAQPGPMFAPFTGRVHYAPYKVRAQRTFTAGNAPVNA